MGKYGQAGTPLYYLGKYRITQRPKQCVRCKQNAYYYHPDFDYLCASHLLDLVNIGGEAFSWDDYPEVWARTERLLQRKPPKSTGAQNTESQQQSSAATNEDSWDGI